MLLEKRLYHSLRMLAMSGVGIVKKRKNTDFILCSIKLYVSGSWMLTARGHCEQVKGFLKSLLSFCLSVLAYSICSHTLDLVCYHTMRLNTVHLPIWLQK